MEKTWRKDKNWTEIKNWDIVHTVFWEFEVWYSAEKTAFMLKNEKCWDNNYLSNFEEVEVVIEALF